jgi:hypothetical protein
MSTPWAANACDNPKAGLAARDPRHPVFANCAPADPPTACKIAANDPAGAEVCAGLELPPGTDELQKPGGGPDTARPRLMKSSDATPATPMTYTLAIPGKAAVPARRRLAPPPGEGDRTAGLAVTTQIVV